MNTPNSPVEDALSPDRSVNVPLLIRGEVAAAIRALGILDTIENPQDRTCIQAAATFLQEPNASKNLPEIVRHAEALAEMMAYMSEVPQEIDAMHEQLLILQCQYHIDLVEAELRKDSPNQTIITESMKWALDIAKTLANPKGYNNDVLLKNVRALEVRISALSLQS